MRLILVETDSPSAYSKEVLDVGAAHLKRLQIRGNMRVWSAKYAGNDAGKVIVTIEWPSLTALAEDDKKMAADPALSAWVRSLSEIRKIVSDSLYSEATP